MLTSCVYTGIKGLLQSLVCLAHTSADTARRAETFLPRTLVRVVFHVGRSGKLHVPTAAAFTSSAFCRRVCFCVLYYSHNKRQYLPYSASANLPL